MPSKLDDPIVVINKFPPNIKDIEKVFDLTNKRPIFAWGGIIFNPYNAVIDEPLRIHELTHFAQQQGKPKEWWDKYLVDKKFRLEQEIEAYSNQYNSYRKLTKDRNFLARYLFRLASDLSSSMYGNIITVSEATKRIKDFKYSE